MPIARRTESVWREIETEIGRRNAAGYNKAASLLLDLHRSPGNKGRLRISPAGSARSANAMPARRASSFFF